MVSLLRLGGVLKLRLAVTDAAMNAGGLFSSSITI
jgi:hypothetical protein